MLIALWLGPALALAAGLIAAPTRARRFWFGCFAMAIVVHIGFVAVSPAEFRLREFLVAGMHPNPQIERDASQAVLPLARAPHLAR